jgi:hypothetical protein
VVDPGSLENFGWPCYESQPRQLGYEGANLNVCENLYGQAGAVTSPHFAYHHTAQYRRLLTPTTSPRRRSVCVAAGAAGPTARRLEEGGPADPARYSSHRPASGGSTPIDAVAGKLATGHVLES